MTEAEALAWLSIECQASAEPVLTEDELAQIVEYARTDDVSVWRVDYAAARGWEIRAGKVADRFDFASDGSSFTRSQYQAHCLVMAASYRKRTAVSVKISRSR